MIKNECEIVKDLIPNYVEDLISKDTREFMENHISSCNNCKKILEEIKKEKNTEEKKESKIEKGQIDYLKKYNRKLNILKVVAGILIAIILVIWSFALVKYINYRKDYKIGEYNHSIIEQSYNKIQEIKNSNNYIYIHSWSGTNTPTYKSIEYYKDGKSKEENYDGHDEIIYINYEIDITDKECYFIQYNQENNGRAAIGRGYNSIPNTMTGLPGYLSSFYGLEIIECADLEIWEDKDLDKNCYVIRKTIDQYQYDELWIDKQTMLPTKERMRSFNDYTEDKYEYKVGEVKDSDVEIDRSEFEKEEWQNAYAQRIMKEILARYSNN